MCDEVQELLGRWYDDELDESTAHHVAEHLDTCPACSDEVAGWRQIDQLLEYRCRQENDCEFMEAVMSGLHREQRSSAQAWWLRVAAAVLLAATCGGLGGWLSTSQGKQPIPAAAEPTSLTLLEESFAPQRLSGLDELAAELGAGIPRRL